MSWEDSSARTGVALQRPFQSSVGLASDKHDLRGSTCASAAMSLIFCRRCGKSQVARLDNAEQLVRYFRYVSTAFVANPCREPVAFQQVAAPSDTIPRWRASGRYSKTRKLRTNLPPIEPKK